MTTKFKKQQRRSAAAPAAYVELLIENNEKFHFSLISIPFQYDDDDDQYITLNRFGAI